MTSLNRFKQRLRGELAREELPQPSPELVIDTVEPVIVETEQLVIVDIPDSISEDVIEDEEPAEMSKLESMTKVEIDGYAAEHGIQLDRRQTKFNMITEFIQKIEEKN